MSRYNDMNHFNKLPIQAGISLIYKAIEKKEEQKAWEMWLMKYQHMDKSSFIPFSQFYKQQTQRKISMRATEDILQEAKAIREKILQKK